MSFANQIENGGTVDVANDFVISAYKVVCVMFAQGEQLQLHVVFITQLLKPFVTKIPVSSANKSVFFMAIL